VSASTTHSSRCQSGRLLTVPLSCFVIRAISLHLRFRKIIPFNTQLFYGRPDGPYLEITVSPIRQRCSPLSLGVKPFPVRTTSSSREFFAIEGN